VCGVVLKCNALGMTEDVHWVECRRADIP